MRVFVDTYVIPEAEECEVSGRYVSQELIDRMAETGILRMRIGPGRHLWGRSLLGGVVRGEEFDAFHDLIVMQELVRAGMRGFQDGNVSFL